MWCNQFFHSNTTNGLRLSRLSEFPATFEFLRISFKCLRRMVKGSHNFWLNYSMFHVVISRRLSMIPFLSLYSYGTCFMPGDKSSTYSLSPSMPLSIFSIHNAVHICGGRQRQHFQGFNELYRHSHSKHRLDGMHSDILDVESKWSSRLLREIFSWSSWTLF